MEYVATKGSTFKVTAGTWVGVGTIGAEEVAMASTAGVGSLSVTSEFSDYCKIDGNEVAYSVSVNGSLVETTGNVTTTTPVSIKLSGSTNYVKDGSSWLLKGDSTNSSITISVVTETTTGPKPSTLEGTQEISIETTQTNTKAE